MGFTSVINDAFQSTLPAREATGGLISFCWLWTIFQSTLPAREATISSRILSMGAGNFNPRFPRGKRPQLDRSFKSELQFQSTLPAREATNNITSFRHALIISIHASREGSDSTVKLSPDDRTSRHGFREPGFLRFRHRQISCLFLLGAWGSRL